MKANEIEKSLLMPHAACMPGAVYPQKQLTMA